MPHLQIHSTFRRSSQLEELVENHFQKVQRFCDKIKAAKVSLKKENKAHLSDVVTINLAIEGEKSVTVTVEDTLFEKALGNAFKIIKRQLKK